LAAVSSCNRETGLVTGGSAAAAQLLSAPAGVYALTPDWNDTAYLLDQTEQALRGGVRWLQYRNKRADAALRMKQAVALRERTWKQGAALLVNDDAELAVAVRADGVHIGRDDLLPDDTSHHRLVVAVFVTSRRRSVALIRPLIVITPPCIHARSGTCQA
jgi:hypothetical protein